MMSFSDHAIVEATAPPDLMLDRAPDRSRRVVDEFRRVPRGRREQFVCRRSDSKMLSAVTEMTPV